MLVEWGAHNWLYYGVYPHVRLKDTDFDKADEGVSYMEFVWRAIREGVGEVIR